MKSDRQMSLSYLLILNLIFLIKGSGSGSDAGLYARMNSVAMSNCFISAMTQERCEKTAGKKLQEKLGIILELIKIKRETYRPYYEPKHELADYYADERADFETELYEIVTELLTIIEKEGLASQEAIGEAWASTFTGSDGK